MVATRATITGASLAHLFIPEKTSTVSWATRRALSGSVTTTNRQGWELHADGVSLYRLEAAPDLILLHRGIGVPRTLSLFSARFRKLMNSL